MPHPFPDAQNLAAYIAATAGRRGKVRQLATGTLVASPVAVTHAYVTAAVPTDTVAPPDTFVNQAVEFFAEMERPFVLWAPESQLDLVTLAHTRGGSEIAAGTVMSIDRPLESLGDLRIDRVTTPEQIEHFGRVAEAGYEAPGMAWLYGEHDAYSAEGSSWFVAYQDDEPVGTASGFLTGEVGGVYNVATPPAHRGRGVGGAITTAVVNHLLVSGAERVVLQASAAGRPVYERLGFQTHGRYLRFVFEAAGR
jgi:GNAT superfamily N-acetyltransferase